MFCFRLLIIASCLVFQSVSPLAFAGGPRLPADLAFCNGLLKFSSQYDLESPRTQLFAHILPQGLESTALPVEFIAGHPLLKDLGIARFFDGTSGVSEGYSLREHTQMFLATIREQKKYFDLDDHHWRLFIFMAVVHDIGKPMGVEDFTQRMGRAPQTKDEFKAASRKQTEFTLPLVDKIMDVFSFTADEKKFVVALLEDDVLGAVVTGRTRPHEAYMNLQKKAERVGMTIEEFFKYKSLMFIADAGSYPGLRYGLGLAERPKPPVFFEDEHGQLMPVAPSYYQLTAMIHGGSDLYLRHQRIRASLMGQAYGDAHGAVTENYTQADIAKVFGLHGSLAASLPLKKIEEVRGRQQLSRVRIPGTTTDDTQQGMGLLWVLTQYPEWGDKALETWAELLTAGADAGAWRGTGSNFRAAVENLKNGVSYKKSGSKASSLGAPMRIAAMAGLQSVSDAAMTEAVITSGLVTHAHLHSAAVSYAVFWITRELIDGVSVASIRKRLPDVVKAIEEKILAYDESWEFDRRDPHAVSQTLAQVLHAPAAGTATVADISALVLQFGAGYKMEGRDLHPNNPSAVVGGVHAIALALAETNDPLGIIHYISNLGDDTDTVAAIAGGMLGARFGMDWIPTFELKDRPRLDLYASSLITGQAPESREDYLRHESEITTREINYQKDISEK